MSTKIHHGWRIHHPHSVGGLTEICSRLADTLGAERQRAYDEFVVRLACHDADEAAAGLTSDTTTPAITKAAVAAWRITQEAEKSPYRNPLDLGCDIVFCHDPSDDDWLYALVYTQHHRYEVLLGDVGFVEYGYWDNTDPPDGLDDAEWERRRDRWDRLIGNDPPAVRGLTWALAAVESRIFGVDDDTVAAMIAGAGLDDAERATRLAETARRRGVDPATLDRLPPLTATHLRRLTPGKPTWAGS